jgi:hypothetical protein
MCQGRKHDLRYPEVEAKYRAGNSFSVRLEDRWLVLAVTDAHVERERLARDTVAHLNGETEILNPKDYALRRPVSLALILSLAGAALVTCIVLVVIVVLSWNWLGTRPIPDGDWQTLSPPGGGFTILMPGSPSSRQRPVVEPGLTATLTVFELERKREGTTFEIGYIDYPRQVGRLPSLEQTLDGFGPRLAAGSNGTIHTQKTIRMDQWVGREFEISVTTPSKGLVVARVYAAGDRLYLLSAAGTKLQADAPEVEKFFASFKVLPVTGPLVKVEPNDPPRLFDNLPKKDPVRPTPPNEGLAGTFFNVGDLNVQEIRVKVTEQAPACLCWSADGRSFYHLDADAGVVRRIALQGFQEQARLDVQAPCRWLSPSGEGLLVTLAGKPEVWVVDPDNLQLRSPIECGFATRVVSAPGLAVAFASSGDGPRGSTCSVLDLKKGSVVRQYSERDFPRFTGLGSPVITPDGKYLFTRGGMEQMHRFRIDGPALIFEESSQRIAQGRIEGICVSPDSQFACLPSGGGNYRGLKDHPETGAYSTYIYPVSNINKPAFFLEQGAYPTAVGFDAKGGLVYGQNGNHQLILFSPTGIKQREYAFPKTRWVRQFAAHPAGRRLLLLTQDKLFYVELPKP